MDILEANNILPVDPKTGELRKVSSSTINRRMKDLGLHMKQLSKGTPNQNLRSLHPNHTWQIDASVCVLFYLPEKVHTVDETAVYKNKPENLEAFHKHKVIRYVVTDHYSGYIYVRYSLGSEDKEGIIFTLIEAISKRSDHDPMHGVPKNIILDRGAGNKSDLVKSFCEKLGINLIYHEVGNPRAKGQVENANNLVERNFEGRLRFLEINSIEELQHQCDLWRSHYNAHFPLRRAGKSRSILWTTIKSEELRVCDRDVLFEIAYWKAVTRKIDNSFQISISTKKFGKNTYDVSALNAHGIMKGDEVEILLNPFTAPNIVVSKKMYDGKEISMEFSPIIFDEAGFNVNAPIIGEEHSSFKKTKTETNLDTMTMCAYHSGTLKEVEEKEKTKRKAFSRP